jgi:hypothetical protein
VVGNASISALAFPAEGAPHLLALNWSALPEWLSPPASPRVEVAQESSAASPREAATPDSVEQRPDDPATTVPVPDGSL